MKKIFTNSIIFLMIVGMVFSFQSREVNAKSTKNSKAHKVLEKQIKKDKKKFCDEFQATLKYAFKDLDGDKIDELITYPGYGYCTEIIYKYKKGKAVKVAVIGLGEFTTYYPKSKVLYDSGSGHMGTYYQQYFKLKKGKYKRLAYRVEIEEDENGLLEKPIYKYYINEKQVKKSKYKRYIKRLKKGKAKKFSKLQWKYK